MFTYPLIQMDASWQWTISLIKMDQLVEGVDSGKKKISFNADIFSWYSQVKKLKNLMSPDLCLVCDVILLIRVNDLYTYSLLVDARFPFLKNSPAMVGKQINKLEDKWM